MGIVQRTLVDKAGKVLIPKSVREKFGIGPNSEVTIETSHDEIIIKPVSKRSIAGDIISMNLPVDDWEVMEEQSIRGALEK
jgi:AbrB family looped-hinge helix DNA binding protein